jgi:hypothetical protein
MQEELIKTLGPILVGVVTLLASWGLAELSRYVRTKTKNEQALGAMDAFSEIVKTTVMDLAQTATGSLKDGKFTSDEATKLKEQAVDRVKAQVTPALEKQLNGAVADLETFLRSKIEAEVLNSKMAKASAGMTVHQEGVVTVEEGGVE